MKLGDGVEWGLHCCTLLALLPDDAALPASRGYGNLLATVSYPDGNPSVNVAQFAHDAISPFVNVG